MSLCWTTTIQGSRPGAHSHTETTLYTDWCTWCGTNVNKQEVCPDVIQHVMRLAQQLIRWLANQSHWGGRRWKAGAGRPRLHPLNELFPGQLWQQRRHDNNHGNPRVVEVSGVGPQPTNRLCHPESQPARFLFYINTLELVTWVWREFHSATLCVEVIVTQQNTT